MKEYQAEMKNTGYGEKSSHMIHTFIFANRIVAEKTSRSKIGVISPQKMMETVAVHLKP